MALTLSACTSPAQLQETTLEQLIEEGIIAVFDPENLEPVEFTLVQAERGDFIQNLDMAVNVVFPRTYHMHFEAETITNAGASITTAAWEHGWFSGIDVRLGTLVSEGDFIAELSYDVPESVVIARHALELERRQFETNFETDNHNRLQDIASLRLQTEIAPEGEWEIYALRLERAELAYRQFMINTTNRREQFEDRLETINEPVATERLYAPFDGVITYTTQHFSSGYFRNMVSVAGSAGNLPAGRRVASVVDLSYKYFFAETNLYSLRYGSIVQIFRQGGEAYFNARVITDPMTANILREGHHRILLLPLEGEWERFMEQIEYELGVHFDPDNFWSILTLRLRTYIPRATDVVYLNSRAIQSENHNYFVQLYDDGAIARRYVEIGPTGLSGPISVTQVLSGLAPGQWVVIP